MKNIENIENIEYSFSFSYKKYKQRDFVGYDHLLIESENNEIKSLYETFINSIFWN